MYKEIAELIGNNDKTIYRWKKEGRPIVSLIEKYFSKEDLEEFLETGKVRKYDSIDTTISISIISFLQKLNVLYHEDGNPQLFYRFIVYYIQYEESFNSDGTWQGLNGIEEFQDIFYQYLVNIGVHMEELRHTSIFINQLSRADLLFLNMNILDGFELMFSFKHPNVHKNFFIIYSRTDLLTEMKHGLKEALKEVVSVKTDNIKQMVEELTMRIKEMRIREAMEKTAKQHNILQSKPEQTGSQADFIAYNIGMLSSLTESRSGWFTLKDGSGADVSFATSKTHGYPLLINEQDTGMPYEVFSSLMQNQNMASQFGKALAGLDLTNKESFDFIIAMLTNMQVGLQENTTKSL